MSETKETIILVDDDTYDRESAKKSLIEFDVIENDNGESFLNSLSQHKPSCVVIDYYLPDVNGDDLIKQVRKYNEDVPIVVITGREDVELAVRLIKSGVQDYVPKSRLENGYLARVVSAAIRLKQKENELEKYRQFYLTAPIGFFTTNTTTGEFLMVNPACVSVLGCESFEDLKSNYKSALDLYSSEERTKFIDAIKEKKVVTDFETVFKLKDGREINVLLSGRFCRNEDCIEGAIVDITETTKLSEELRKLREETLTMTEETGSKLSKFLKNYDS